MEAGSSRIGSGDRCIYGLEVEYPKLGSILMPLNLH